MSRSSSLVGLCLAAALIPSRSVAQEAIGVRPPTPSAIEGGGGPEVLGVLPSAPAAPKLALKPLAVSPSISYQSNGKVVPVVQAAGSLSYNFHRNVFDEVQVRFDATSTPGADDLTYVARNIRAVPGTYKASLGNRLMIHANRDAADGSLGFDLRLGVSAASQVAEYTDADSHLSKGSFLLTSADVTFGAWLIYGYVGVRLSRFWANASDDSQIQALALDLNASNGISGVCVISLAQATTIEATKPLYAQVSMSMSPGHLDQATWSFGLTGVFEPL